MEVLPLHNWWVANAAYGVRTTHVRYYAVGWADLTVVIDLLLRDASNSKRGYVV
jgi:hypothetical protein